MGLVFILLGRGGAGKTTTAQYYSQRYNIPIVRPAEEIRILAKQGDPKAQEATARMNKGEMISPLPFIAAIERKLKESPSLSSSGFILDAFPGIPEAIPPLEELLRKNNLKIGRVIELRVPKPQSFQRQLKRGREDATALEQREHEFKTKESIVLEYYRKKGLLKIIHTRNLKKRSKRQPSFFVQHQAKQLHKILRATNRTKKRA